jgi:hypothetical protein
MTHIVRECYSLLLMTKTDEVIHVGASLKALVRSTAPVQQALPLPSLSLGG